MKMKPLPFNKNVFVRDKKIYTKNLVRGDRVYGEKILKIDGEEYREWNPKRSKLCAAIIKGLKILPLREGTKVLYLGASTGTTVSHVSDIVKEKGIIFAVEFAPRVGRELYLLSKRRVNIYPILADANLPLTYYPFLTQVDVVFQDIAQPNQVEILVKNIYYYLREKGYFMLAVKSRSIDITKKPQEIYFLVRKHLEEYGLKILQEIKLDPYEKDHIFYIGRYDGYLKEPGSIKWIDILEKYYSKKDIKKIDIKGINSKNNKNKEKINKRNKPKFNLKNKRSTN